MRQLAFLLVACVLSTGFVQDEQLPNDLKEWGLSGSIKEFRSKVYRHPEDGTLVDTTEKGLSSIIHAFFNLEGNIYLTENSYGLNSGYPMWSRNRIEFEQGLKSTYTEEDSLGNITANGTYLWSGTKGYLLHIEHDGGGTSKVMSLLDENLREQAGAFTYSYDGERYYEERYVNHFDSLGRLMYVHLDYPLEGNKIRQEYRNIQLDDLNNPIRYEVYRDGTLYQLVKRTITYYQ